jgi:hypothetical protein
MNRGILLTPFHNMALMSPATAPDDVDLHSKVFRESVRELMGCGTLWSAGSLNRNQERAARPLL